MTQPGGSVIYATPGVNFMLRSSPIVCAVDAILLMVLFCKHSWTHGVREARRRLLYVRFKAGHDDDELSEISPLRKNRVVRYIGFAISLVQYVRLYAFSGCTATQVVATTYLVSFVTTEALTFGSGGPIPIPQVDSPRLFDRITRALPDLTIPQAAFFAFYIAATSFRDGSKQPDQSLMQWLGIVLLTAVSTLIIPSFVFGATYSSHWANDVIFAIVLPSIVVIPASYVVLQMTMANNFLSTAFMRTTLVALPTFWIFFCSFFMSSALRESSSQEHSFGERAKARMRGRVEQSASWVFVVLHLAAAFLWHKYSYKSDGTSAPAWTDFLG